MRRAAIFSLFFVSGFAGLVYEILWLRLFSRTFGNTTQAGAVVIGAFMGGLALGAWWIGKKADHHQKPLRLYAYCEFGVAFFALLLLGGYFAADYLYAEVFRSVGPDSIILTILRILISFLLMALPCAMMGATLPILARRATPQAEQSGKKTGLLYFINTLGAMVGAIFSGFFAIKTFGVYPTFFFAVALNIAAGIIAFKLSKTDKPLDFVVAKTISKKWKSKGDKEEKSRDFYILFIAGAAGFFALALEVMYTRLVLFALSYTVYVWTIVLSIFLAGIAIGAAFGARRSAKTDTPLTLAAYALIWMSTSMWLILIFISKIQIISNLSRHLLTSTGWAQAVAFQFIVVAVTLFLPAFCSGYAFPLLVKAAVSKTGVTGKEVGKIYGVNTLAGIGGSLIAGFLLIPTIGAQRGIFWSAMILFNLGTYLSYKLSPKARSRAIPLTVAIIVGILALIIPGNNINLKLMTSMRPAGGSALMIEDDVNATVIVYEVNGFREIDINGVQTAGTDPAMRTTQILQGHIPMMMHPNPEKVLMVGFGTGETARICTMYGVSSVDVAEISSEVLGAAKFFDNINENITKDPKFKGIVTDGANYMRFSDKRYDVIMSDSIHPAYFGNATLYSQDYFLAAKERLAPDGVMTSWIPLFDLTDQAFRMMVNSFVSVFPNSALIYGHTTFNRHALLVAKNNNKPLFSVEKMADSFKDPRISKSLKTVDIDEPLDLVNFMIMGYKGLPLYLKGAKINTDNLPLLEFEAPRSGFGPEAWRNNLRGILAKRENPLKYIDLSGYKEKDSFLARFNNRFIAAGQVLNAIATTEMRPDAMKEKLLAAKELSPGVAGVDVILNTLKSYSDSLANVTRATSGKRIPLALAQMQVGNYEQALALLKAELMENPNSIEALGNLGMVYLKKNDLDKAVETFRRVLAINKGDVDAQRQLGIALFHKGDYAQSAVWFETLANSTDADADIFTQLGMAKHMMSKFEEAEEAFLKAISKDPNFVRAYVGYGTLLMHRRRFFEARNNFDKAISLDPNNKIPYGNIGMIFLAEKNPAGAIKMFEKVLELDPSDSKARQMIESIKSGN